MHTNKAQSAIEFLSTYAWALLIIVVLLAVLFILTSAPAGKQVLPSICNIQPQLPCQDSVLSALSSTQQITYFITFTNNLQKPMEIAGNGFNVTTTGIGVQGSSHSIGTCYPSFLLPGTQTVCVAPIAGNYEPSIGSKISTYFQIRYALCQSDAQSSCAGAYLSSGNGLQDLSGASSGLSSFYPVTFTIDNLNPQGQIIDTNGIILLNGQQYTSGQTALIPSSGNYPLSAQPPAGFSFSSWSTNNIISTISPTNTASSTLDILSAVNITATSNEIISLPSYYVLVTASPSVGGNVLPASGYYKKGTVLTLSETSNPPYIFTGWAGTGSGSFTGSNPSTSITVNGAITETAGYSFTAVFELGAVTPPYTNMDQGQGVLMSDYGASGGKPPYTYQWLAAGPGGGNYSSGGGNLYCAAPASTSCSFLTNSLSPIGTYSFELQATDSVGRVLASAPVNVIVYPQLAAGAIYGQGQTALPTYIDQGQVFAPNVLALYGNPSGGTGTANYLYQWYDCYSGFQLPAGSVPSDSCYSPSGVFGNSGSPANALFSQYAPVGFHYVRLGITDAGVSPWATPSPMSANSQNSNTFYVGVYNAIVPALTPNSLTLALGEDGTLTSSASGGRGPTEYEWWVIPQSGGIYSPKVDYVSGSDTYVFNSLVTGNYLIYTQIKDQGVVLNPYIASSFSTVQVINTITSNVPVGLGTEPSCAGYPVTEFTQSEVIGPVTTPCDIKIDSGVTLTGAPIFIAGGNFTNLGIIQASPENGGGQGGGASAYGATYIDCHGASVSANPGSGGGGGGAFGGGGGGGGGGAGSYSTLICGSAGANGGNGGGAGGGGGGGGTGTGNIGIGGCSLCPVADSGGIGGGGPGSITAAQILNDYYTGLSGGGGGGGGGAGYVVGAATGTTNGGGGGSGSGGVYIQANAINNAGTITTDGEGGTVYDSSCSDPNAEGGGGGGGGGGTILLAYNGTYNSIGSIFSSGGGYGAPLTSCTNGLGDITTSGGGGNGGAGAQIAYDYHANNGGTAPVPPPVLYLLLPAPVSDQGNLVLAGNTVSMSDSGAQDGVTPFTYSWEQQPYLSYTLSGQTEYYCGNPATFTSGGSGTVPTNYIFTAASGTNIFGYCIGLSVADKGGFYGQAETVVKIPASAPGPVSIATPTYSPSSVYSDTIVTVNDIGASGGIGSPYTYAWLSGFAFNGNCNGVSVNQISGGTGTAPSNYVFNTGSSFNGAYCVQLEATDSAGNQGLSAQITIPIS